MLYVIILIGLIVVGALWTISAQRRFVGLNENINNAMSQIGVQLASRWAALGVLFDLINKYAQSDYETITEILTSKRSVSKGSSIEDIQKQLRVIASAMSKISVIAEKCPTLKMDQAYFKTVEAVKQYESMVRTSSLIYNNSVMKFNHAIGIFPINVIARLEGFTKRDYLEVD